MLGAPVGSFLFGIFDYQTTFFFFSGLVLGVWFMILKTPASLYLNFPEQESKYYFPFTYTLIMLINYTNHAVNLFLYIGTSSVFRNEFREIFKQIKASLYKNKQVKNQK